MSDEVTQPLEDAWKKRVKDLEKAIQEHTANMEALALLSLNMGRMGALVRPSVFLGLLISITACPELAEGRLESVITYLNKNGQDITEEDVFNGKALKKIWKE